MAKKKKTAIKTVYRSSISGRFTTKKYATRKPKTTERQRMKVGR